MKDHVRNLKETPTWAVASVITVMVAFGFAVQISLKHFGKWLDRTKRKSLFAALEKIKEELVLFGVLSLLMGHWIFIVAKICVKSSVLDSRFLPCAIEDSELISAENVLVSASEFFNKTAQSIKKDLKAHHHCPENHESFASHESLEQLHRLIFVLGTTHVLYSFASIVLAMLKIYSWRIWENEAKAMANRSLQDTPEALQNSPRLNRMSTFVDHQTSHPWSHHRILVWLLCFSRQFWSSINRSDYMALRSDFLTTHELPLSYDFHKYMLRSMEEEFRDIVGISIPLWVYTICCIFLDFHGSNIYFWLSFVPAILILLIGTKLHHVVVKLAVEITGNNLSREIRQNKLRDNLFWFGKPKLLLHIIQLISYQNAFEMATFLWSLWEVQGPSCFMDDRKLVVIRLSFGVMSQFWCSFVTFPLYVIITQMSSRFKKTVIAENVRKSLSGWQRRVKARHATSQSSPFLSSATITPSDSVASGLQSMNELAAESNEGEISSVVGAASREVSFEIASQSGGIPVGSVAVSCDAETTQFAVFESHSFAANDNEIRRRTVITIDHVSPSPSK